MKKDGNSFAVPNILRAFAINYRRVVNNDMYINTMN